MFVLVQDAAETVRATDASLGESVKAGDRIG
jgi:hypothetical protein